MLTGLSKPVLSVDVHKNQFFFFFLIKQNKREWRISKEFTMQPSVTLIFTLTGLYSSMFGKKQRHRLLRELGMVGV